MSQEQDFQEIEEEYEAEENAKHDMRMRRMGEMSGRKADPHHVVAGNDRHADPGIL